MRRASHPNGCAGADLVWPVDGSFVDSTHMNKVFRWHGSVGVVSDVTADESVCRTLDIRTVSNRCGYARAEAAYFSA